MNELPKYTLPEEKYSVDEFLEVYKQRVLNLYTKYENLTVEEARIKYRKLFDDCPVGLLINPFGLENDLKKHFPNFWDSSNSRTYKIQID
jgi:hypothetical protein